jgi:hypothetical protein
MDQIIKLIGKLWKCFLKSNKGSGNFLPLQNIFNYQNSEKDCWWWRGKMRFAKQVL